MIQENINSPDCVNHSSIGLDYKPYMTGFIFNRMEKEIWKPVRGYEGFYEVSNLGRARSLTRSVSYFYMGNKNDKRTRVWPSHYCKFNMAGKAKYLMVALTRNGERKLISVHTLVASSFLGYEINGKSDLVVDHIDENKLNNNLCNLQIITLRENLSKYHKTQNNTSKYTGVNWNKKLRKWVAQIHINNNKKHLGVFVSEEDAAKAYQNELIKTKE